mmetsp:Transcript_10172/g.10144  ORF Transcript_10172/g.10144 Transcript_10172/m.10144 type:complete len:100 (+) Transcript_10172:1352-1651(+)
MNTLEQIKNDIQKEPLENLRYQEKKQTSQISKKRPQTSSSNSKAIQQAYKASFEQTQPLPTSQPHKRSSSGQYNNIIPSKGNQPELKNLNNRIGNGHRR